MVRDMQLVALNDSQFRRLSEFIESEVGIKMPPTKRIMLESRLRKRLRVLGIDSFEEYIEYVFSSHAGEIIHMIDVVTTNKTDFFRESQHFDYMTDTLLPEEYGKGWGRGSKLKVWSAASSTGEEAYTLAIVLSEFARDNPGFDYRILGTDISTAVLDAARKGVYRADRIDPVDPVLRRRYFLKSRNPDSGLVRVRADLRRRAQFHRLNLMHERYPIRDKFHIIFCRNVIIYFERPRQMELLNRLYQHLIPGGYLFLGHSESLAGMSLPVETVAPTIYRRVEW